LAFAFASVVAERVFHLWLLSVLHQLDTGFLTARPGLRLT
jgi:hypothetical protein